MNRSPRMATLQDGHGLSNSSDPHSAANSSSTWSQHSGIGQSNISTQAIPSCYHDLINIPLTIKWDQSKGYTQCLDGFYCRNVTQEHPPQYCIPNDACLMERLGRGVCDEPQGVYEPMVCKRSFYCPDGGREQIPCPKGFYCPTGSAKPLKCPFGAVCPFKTDTYLPILPVAATLAFDLFICVVVLALYLYRSPSWRKLYPKSAIDTESCRKRRMQESLQPEQAEYTDTAAVQAFVASVNKCVGTNDLGLSFRFHELGCEPVKGKKILSNISGEICSRSMWGVMGGSGAGKSTFINVLMGKLVHGYGDVFINGYQKDMSQYKKLIGYVPQDDIVLPELTVRENLLHAARIRLPSTWSDSEKRRHVDYLVSCLGLSEVQNRRVGSTIKPSLSGGQRKRVSIGIELAAAPMAILLDEPTSGLDATSASSLMRLLKEISRLGVTTVTVMHQPRQQIFASLDNLLLLSEGRQIYAGPTNDVVEYFENLGYKIPANENPADVLIDIITGEGRLYASSAKLDDNYVQDLAQTWIKHTKLKTAQASNDESSDRSKVASVSVVSSNGSVTESVSALEEKSSAQRLQSNPVTSDSEIALATTLQARGAKRRTQVWHCCKRAVIQQWRDKSGFWFEMAVSALGGALIGLAAASARGQWIKGLYRKPFEIFSPAFDYTNATQVALLTSMMLGCVSASPGVRVFGEEKLVYWRETASGHSRLAYYLGKLVGTFPRMALNALHFTAVFAFVATPLIPFGKMYLANFLWVYCAYGLASCLSVVVRRENGPLLAVVAVLTLSVFGGVAPPLRQVQKWGVVWLWRLSPGVWFAEVYFGQSSLPFRDLYQVDLASSFLGFPLDRYKLCVAVMFAMGTVYRVLALVGLLFVDRRRQR